MRIVFLTASLEPGRDGVGDYTRDLAAACIRLGTPATVIALNDRHLRQQADVVQDSRGTVVPCLRLPANAAWRERSAAALEWIREYDPDWISLQFVPYGFNDKGLVIGWSGRIAALCRNRRVHIMFHELWIGLDPGVALRERVVGWLQRQAVLRLVRHLAPATVHTSNAHYEQVLMASGIRSRRLPLCGSVPIASNDATWLERELRAAEQQDLLAGTRSALLCVGLFGSLHPAWTPEPLFTHLQTVAESRGKQVVVLSIGRVGPGLALWHRLTAGYGQRIRFVLLGERDRTDLSQFLQHIDYGIATTPWKLIGKSATAAAMLEHGVPVIVTRTGTDATDAPADDSLLVRLDDRLRNHLEEGIPRRPARELLTQMAHTFMSDLERSEAGHS